MSTFIEQEQENFDDPKEEPYFQKKVTWRSICCNKLVKGILIVIIVAAIFPILAYYFAISRSVSHDDDQRYSCLIEEDYRIPCGYIGITAKECEAAMCCYNKTIQMCHHYLPSKYYYQQESGDLFTTSPDKSPVGSKIVKTIQFTAEENGKKLSLVIQNPLNNVRRRSFIISKMKNFNIIYSTKKLILEIQDNDNDTIFSSGNAALIASENYWEWSFQLTNDTLFGLDRNTISLTGNQTLTKVIYKNRNDHTTQPVIWAYKNKKFYGCLIKHEGPIELTVLASNIVIVRSLVGKKLEIELSLGPSPAELYKNQVQNINLSPVWALGTHNCRKGSSIDLAELLKTYAIDNTYSFDTDCLHENLFMSLQLGNNSDADLNDFKTTLEKFNASNTKFVLSLPPHILANKNNTLYKDAIDLDILYKDSTGIYQGVYLGQSVVYPDFSHSSISSFVEKLVEWIEVNVGLENVTGLVLNDNWPQDDSLENVDSSKFPYFSPDLNQSMKYTLPWNLQTFTNQLHLVEHNSYGSLQYSVLNDYINKTNTNFFIASATKQFGDNEPEISENFNTSWDNFRVYLDKMLFSSISGDYMIGLPICGDTTSYKKALHETLCVRWYLASATMPYFRVSSGDPFRDPSNLNTLFSTNAVSATITRRKQLIEYFYTILSKGEPLIRPMYYDYYSNTTTFTLEGQYAIGKDVLVCHPLTSGKAKLHVYLPPERGVWYEFWGGTMLTPTKKNGYFVDIDILETDWISVIAQGSIISLTNSLEINLYIALNCSKDGCTAQGELFEDNTYIYMTATDTSVTISNLPTDCEYKLGFINYYGYSGTSGYTGRFEGDVTLCTDGSNSTTVIYVSEPTQPN